MRKYEKYAADYHKTGYMEAGAASVIADVR
jgi:hypothetical protein